MSFVGPDTRCVGIALNSLGVAHYREAMTVFEHEDSYDEEATTATADATRAMHANSAKIFLHEAARILQCICDHDLEMATVLFNLGRVLMLREEGYDDALICLERAWQIRSHHLGQDHRDCGKTTLNAAHAWHVLGDVKTALERYEQFVRIESVQLTINQREVSAALLGMAQIHEEYKNYTEAESMFESSLAVGRTGLCDVPLHKVALVNRVGRFYVDRQRWSQALELYQESLVLLKCANEKSNTVKIEILVKVGQIYRQMNNFPKSVKMFVKVMKLERLRHGDTSAEVAATHYVIGMIHQDHGNMPSALSSFRKSLSIRRIALGSDHVSTSDALMSLGSVQCEMGMPQDALDAFNESLRIRIINHGPDHPSVAVSVYNVALCHTHLGNYSSAANYFLESLRLEELLIGQGHPDTSQTLQYLADAYKLDGKLDEAFEIWEKGLAIERLIPAANSESKWIILHEMGNVHLKGQIGPAMTYFADAVRMFDAVGLTAPSVSLSALWQLYNASWAPVNLSYAAPVA